MQEEQREMVKEQLHKKLKDDEMEIISLTENKEKIYWQEEGKEFLYKGQLYDVVKTTTVAGKIVLYCISDNKEKEIVNAYNATTKNNSSKDKKVKTTIETATTLFIIENKKLENFSFYKPFKEYCLFITQLPVGITNQLLQPPKC